MSHKIRPASLKSRLAHPLETPALQSFTFQYMLKEDLAWINVITAQPTDNHPSLLGSSMAAKP